MVSGVNKYNVSTSGVMILKLHSRNEMSYESPRNARIY